MTKFSSIHKLLDHLRANKKVNGMFPIEQKAPTFEWLDDGGENEGVIIPSMNYVNDLSVYRGQNTRYQPCVSSLLRGKRCDADLFIYKIKMAEFQALLDSNPLTNLSKKYGLKVNVEALAQHYGLETIHLDVTHSLDVAAFFACCKLEGDSWIPMRDGVGVFYRLLGIPNHTFEIVGPQIYPRPKEQLAESVRVDIGEDFEKKPFVEIFEFDHSYADSLVILKKFNYGKDLFPHDPLGEKANLIAKENTLSIHTCKRVLKDDGIPQEEWESRIQEVNSKLKLSGKGLISERCEHTFSKTESDNIRIHTSSLGNLGFRPIFSPNE